MNVFKESVVTLTVFENVPDPLKGQLRDTQTLIDDGEVLKVALELSLHSGIRIKVNRYYIYISNAQ